MLSRVLRRLLVGGVIVALAALAPIRASGGEWGIARASEQGREAALVTKAARANPPTLRFAVIGDYGYAGPPEAAVAALVHGWQPDFVITTGDNNYDSGAAVTIDANIGQYYHDFIAPYAGSYGSGAEANRFFPSLGNHDYNTANAQPYLDYFTLPGNERYYSFVRGSVELFAINSNPQEPDGITAHSAQAQWLQAALAASTAPWKIVYLHHAPYSSGPHGSTPTLQWPFAAWGASAVLAGHDHTYERLHQDGIVYFVNGLGGRSLYGVLGALAGSAVRYSADYGAMRVTADCAWLTFEFYTRTGVLIDGHGLRRPCAGAVYYDSFLPLLHAD